MMFDTPPIATSWNYPTNKPCSQSGVRTTLYVWYWLYTTSSRRAFYSTVHELELEFTVSKYIEHTRGPFSSVLWKCQKKCNGQKMRLDWIPARISLNFHFLVSKWHLIASKYPKFAVPWKWRFPARPFYSQMQWAKNEMGLDSTQNLSKFSISGLKMALNWL